MYTFSYYKNLVVLILIVIIFKCDTKRSHLKEGEEPPKRDYRPSKWVANSAMDVWYGNKSVIDVFSREFSDILYKLTMRPTRSLHERNNSSSSPSNHYVAMAELRKDLVEKFNETISKTK